MNGSTQGPELKGGAQPTSKETKIRKTATRRKQAKRKRVGRQQKKRGLLLEKKKRDINLTEGGRGYHEYSGNVCRRKKASGDARWKAGIKSLQVGKKKVIMNEARKIRLKREC